MILYSQSIDKFVTIATGQLLSFILAEKKNIDSILTEIGKKELVETYEECFRNKPEITNNRQYSKKVFKLQNYTRLKIEELNGTKSLEHFILSLIGQAEFIDDLDNLVAKELSPDDNVTPSYEYTSELVQSLNEIFANDNCSIAKVEQTGKYHIYSLDDCFVTYNCLFNETQTGNFVLINEHNDKCYKKILSSDYSGAITNSRSLLEQILREIQISIHQKENPGTRNPKHNGKIEPLMNNVFEKLKITENLEGQPKAGYEKLEAGFKEINAGISVLRHGMSDAHNISFTPLKKDALLVVNSAKTLANFLVEVYFEKFGNTT